MELPAHGREPVDQAVQAAAGGGGRPADAVVDDLDADVPLGAAKRTLTSAARACFDAFAIASAALK